LHKKRDLAVCVIRVSQSCDGRAVNAHRHSRPIHDYRQHVLLARGIEKHRRRWSYQKDGLRIPLRVQVFFADREALVSININPVVMVKIRVAAHKDAHAIIVARLSNRKDHRENEIAEGPVCRQAFD